MLNLSDPKVILPLLARQGFHFSKGLGQNFLVDSTVCPEMAALSGAAEVDGVIEIGPGFGVLTYELSQIAKKVVAIEIDRQLLPVLKETLNDCDNVEIVMGDVMKLDLAKLIEEHFGSNKKVCVCANLPYYITTPIIMNLLEHDYPITSLTVMVQKEAANRLCAPLGTRACGAVSASVRYHSEPSILFDVSRDAFIPSPKVDSCVIKLIRLETPPVKIQNKNLFFKVIKAAFAQRRKTVVNSISSTMGVPKRELASILESYSIDTSIRAERLTMEAFADLTNGIEQLKYNEIS